MCLIFYDILINAHQENTDPPTQKSVTAGDFQTPALRTQPYVLMIMKCVMWFYSVLFQERASGHYQKEAQSIREVWFK